MLKKNKTELFNHALDLFFAEQYSEALSVLMEIYDPESIDETQSDITRRIGCCLVNLGRVEESFAYFNQALAEKKQYKKTDHDDPWILQSLAEAYKKVGKFEKAIELYNQIIHQVNDLDDFEYVSGEYEELVDLYQEYKNEQILGIKRIQFLEKIQLRLNEIDEVSDEELRMLFDKKQKLDV